MAKTAGRERDGSKSKHGNIMVWSGQAFGTTIRATKRRFLPSFNLEGSPNTRRDISGCKWPSTLARRYVNGIIKELLSKRFEFEGAIRVRWGDPQSHRNRSVLGGGKKRNSLRSVLRSLFCFDVVVVGGGRHLMGLSSGGNGAIPSLRSRPPMEREREREREAQVAKSNEWRVEQKLRVRGRSRRGGREDDGVEPIIGLGGVRSPLPRSA